MILEGRECGWQLFQTPSINIKTFEKGKKNCRMNLTHTSCFEPLVPTKIITFELTAALNLMLQRLSTTTN